MIRPETNNTSLTFMPRLSFSIVGDYLGKKDSRTIKTWCNKNDVYYDRDENGNYYVIQKEFLFKANMKAEKVMIEKYGKNWEEQIMATVQNKVDKAESITHLTKNNYTTQVSEAEYFAKKWNHL